MNTFNNIVRESVLEAYNGYCCVDGCYEKAIECHHALHNTEINQKLYPLFIQSVWNCKPVCRKHHDSYRQFSELNITTKLARVYEQYLKDLKGGDNV